MAKFPLDILTRTTKPRTMFFVVADIILIAFSVWMSFALRFDGNIPAEYSETIRTFIILALIFCIPIFYFSRLYSFTWSYVSTQELISLLKATTMSFLFLGIAFYISKDHHLFWGFPRSTIFMSYFLVLFLSGGIRFSKRLYFQVFRDRTGGKKERTLIVGAGDAGEQILRSIQTSHASPYLPIGFIDDDASKKGKMIHGIQVLGPIKETPKVVKVHKIERMIVAFASAGSEPVRRAVEMGRKAGIQKIKILPSFSEIINSESSVASIREVQPEDLLDREPVLLDWTAIEESIKGRTVLITGAAGSIGSELSRQVAKFNPSSLLILDQDETGIFNISKEINRKFTELKITSIIADIRDKEKMEKVFSNFRPNVIFHAAAYKHVPLMESQPDEAVKNNIFGTKVVADLSLKHGAENFVFISTDKSVNPSSVMGATKRMGEMICQALNRRNKTKFVSVRFGNVLDSRGSVISVFKEKIEKRETIEITHAEMKRYFMTTPEAVLLVLQAGAMGRGGEVFILDMGDPIKIIDLAKEMIRLSGLEPDKDIPIVFTEPRPGEKFFEEILTAEEGIVATKNKKIFIAELSGINENRLNSNLGKLRKEADNLNRDGMIKILKSLISSYDPLDY